MASPIYGLELQARSICPLYHAFNTEHERHRFLVGTTNYTTSNNIHLFEFQDGAMTLECTAVWSHSKEVRGIWSSPSLSGKSLLATASPETLQIFQIQDILSNGLKQIYAMHKETTQALWDLEGLQDEIKIVHLNSLSTISLEADKLGSEVASYSIECERIEHAALDPHHSSICLLTCGSDGLQMIDFRFKKVSKVGNSDNLHGFRGTSFIDFSPSKPNKLLTCGEDGLLRLHDFRMNSKGVSLDCKRYFKVHEHRVQRSLFNPFHDDLVLTGGSDQALRLWDLSKYNEPVCLKELNDFGDSVVDLSWSSNGPWVFAGVSYNGKFLVDNVPNEKKMSILLEEENY